MAPLVSQLIVDGIIEPQAFQQLETFNAGVTWARTEGFISAPETNHAIASVIREAKRAKEEGKEKTILINWSGHGLVDLAAYDAFFTGKLADHEFPDVFHQLGQLARVRQLKAIECQRCPSAGCLRFGPFADENVQLAALAWGEPRVVLYRRGQWDDASMDPLWADHRAWHRPVLWPRALARRRRRW